MRPHGDLTPIQWYEAAAHWHLQEHQGCPCCGGRHCVFRSEWGLRVEYYCTACDFSASHDAATGRFFTTAAAGRERPAAVLDPVALRFGGLAEGA
jgi:hypothetical protein